MLGDLNKIIKNTGKTADRAARSTVARKQKAQQRNRRSSDIRSDSDSVYWTCSPGDLKCIDRSYRQDGHLIQCSQNGCWCVDETCYSVQTAKWTHWSLICARSLQLSTTGGQWRSSLIGYLQTVKRGRPWLD